MMKKEDGLIILLVGVMVLWALLAPLDATLGVALRWVYLHVAFTWAGTGLINVTGILGIALLVRPGPKLVAWFYPLEAVAVGLYSVGFVLSLISSATSWGGILWQEPRVLSSILVIGVGASAVFVIRNLQKPRWTGLVALLYAILVAYRLISTRVVFHPKNAVGATESIGIIATFYGLMVIAMAVGVLLVRRIGVRGDKQTRALD